jgi:hypothetical protein
MRGSILPKEKIMEALEALIVSGDSTAGKMADFLPETENVRKSDWTVAPADIADRRVEITGPTDRKMVIGPWSTRTIPLTPWPESLRPSARQNRAPSPRR